MMNQRSRNLVLSSVTSDLDLDIIDSTLTWLITEPKFQPNIKGQLKHESPHQRHIQLDHNYSSPRFKVCTNCGLTVPGKSFQSHLWQHKRKDYDKFDKRELALLRTHQKAYLELHKKERIIHQTCKKVVLEKRQLPLASP